MTRVRNLPHTRKYLPDVNLLIALSDKGHEGYRRANKWFQQIEPSASFVLCPLTEAGFVRLAASPKVGKRDFADAVAMLQEMTTLPNYGYFSIQRSWLELIQPFAIRLHGYKQITDAYLLGLAIEEDGILVTLDTHISALAGSKYASYILTIL